MLRAFEKLDTFYGSNGWAFLEWLLSLANSARRKEFRRLEHYREAAAVAASSEASSEASPDSELEASEDHEKRERFVRSALKLLPQAFRELLEAQQFENKSIHDSIILYGLTPNTVKTKLRRGKLRLRWTLRGMGLGYKVIEGVEPFDARYARLLDPNLKRILFASACKTSVFETRRVSGT
jgi:RNA polymerase sigma-70 factor (ECF subfamily)